MQGWGVGGCGAAGGGGPTWGTRERRGLCRSARHMVRSSVDAHSVGGRGARFLPPTRRPSAHLHGSLDGQGHAAGVFSTGLKILGSSPAQGRERRRLSPRDWDPGLGATRKNLRTLPIARLLLA